MARPAGVTILGVLAIIGGAFTILLGLLFMLGSAFFAHRVADMPLFFAGLAGVGGAFLIAFGALDLILGIGMLSLANWARILTMICAAFGLAGSALRLLRSLVFFPVFLVSRQLVVCAIYALILWYLSQPHIKRAFGAAPPASAPSAPGAPAPSA